jgi:gas vesicle protein
MRRLLAFIGGVLSGGAIGTAVALLFTPASGGAMREGVRARYADAIKAGQEAAAQKRQELEARLYEITGPHPADSPAAINYRPPSKGKR